MFFNNEDYLILEPRLDVLIFFVILRLKIKMFLNFHGIQYFNESMRTWSCDFDGVEVILERTIDKNYWLVQTEMFVMQ